MTHHLPRLSSHCSAHQITKITNRLGRRKVKNTTLQCAHTNTEPCESNSAQLPEILTQLNLSKSQFMCQMQCEATPAKLMPPLFKHCSGTSLCFFFHINGIIRWDGVGANHIFPPVSLSPKPHLSQFFTAAPLILLPFDVSCCLYKINKIYSRKNALLYLHLAYFEQTKATKKEN